MSETHNGDPDEFAIRDLKSEQGAEDLIDSPALRAYVKLAGAVIGKKNLRPALEKLASLPLEERYTWRVASALKWAFADFESLNVAADRRTLSQEDLDRLVDLLRLRPLQFCLFLSAFFGEAQMEQLITSSVEQAKKMRASKRQSMEKSNE